MLSFKYSLVPSLLTRILRTHKVTRGPFLERPGNLMGPKSYFEIKVSRKVWCVLTSNEVCIRTLPGASRNGPQLPDGLIAHLVEHCTGIAEVMSSYLVEA